MFTNTSAASSWVLSTGIPSISIRGVRISPASSSSKLNALRRRLPSSLSMLPSSCASSTIVNSSSDVMPWLPDVLNRQDSSFFHCPNSQLIGVRTIRSPLIIGAENIANFSGDSFAMLFGEISPKINTTTVITSVEIPAPISSPRSFTNKIVAREEHPILTILLPIRIVDNRLS